MLLPKRVKYRKQQRGRMTGVATRGNKVTYGVIGVKVWIYKGEVLADSGNTQRRRGGTR